MHLRSLHILFERNVELLKYLLLIALLMLSTYIGWLYVSREIFFDDAFMFIRYAENLSRYGIFGWNHDEATYGCTSIGYVFSTFLLIKAGLLQVLSQAKLIQIQSLFYLYLSLFFLYKSSRLILEKQKSYSILLSLGVVLLVLLNPLMRRNITGMDTSMALCSNAALLFACFSFYRKNTPKHLFFLCLAAYVSFAVRPDNGLYATLFPFLFLLIWHKNKRDLILFTLGIGVTLCLDSLIKYYYFGAVLPIPFYVKAQNFYEAYLGIDLWNTWHYLADFILYSSPFILAAALFYKKKNSKKILPLLLPLVLTQAYFLQTVPVMGYESRLLLPSLPFLVAITLILAKEGTYKQLYSLPFVMRRVVVSSIILVLSLVVLYKGGSTFYAHKKAQALEAAKAYDLGMALRPSGTIISWDAVAYMTRLIQEIDDSSFVFAASEHGFISSNNPTTKILCLVGLHNPLSLAGKALSAQEINVSLQAYQPDLIWMPHFDYPALNQYILKAPYFQQNYDFYPGLVDFGVAIKKDSPYEEKILRSLAEMYPNKDLKVNLGPISPKN